MSLDLPAPDDWSRLCAADARDLAPDVMGLIQADRQKEAGSLNLIASASYAPLALRQIEGSHLVNRAPMGWVGRRSVANCEQMDAMEQLAIDRARAVFGAEFVNVQALSSTIANVGVLRALLPETGGRILVLDEVAGGHVSHAAGRHITSLTREVESFGVRPEGQVDYEAARAKAQAFRPDVLLVGPSSYPREIDYAALRSIADEVGALLFTDIAHVSGLIAAGLHANPVPFSDVATTSTQKTLCGPRNGAFVFAKARFGAAIDAAIFPGLQGPAASNVIAARAVLMDLVTRRAFRALMERVLANAQALCAGLRAGGVELYTGGTDSHLVMSFTGEDWDAPALTAALARYGILGNAMTAPHPGGERRRAFRLGSVALTVRGVGAAEFETLGRDIAAILTAGPGAAVDPARLARMRALAELHPVPSFVD